MFKNIFSIVFTSIFVVSCATWEVIDQGSVIGDAYQLPDPKRTCDKTVQKGKGIGRTVGAGIGGTAGAVTGIFFSFATLGLAAPLIPTLTASGAAAVGGAGGAVGGLAGQAVSNNEVALFEYEVHPDKMNIDYLYVNRCDEIPLPDGTKVDILQKKNEYSIEPIEPVNYN